MYSIINSQMFTFNNLAQWVEQCCLHLQEFLRSQRNYATSCTIDKAKQYIQQNYKNSDLSVDMLCEHLHISPAYFSTLFKRKTGLSFTAYVNKVRMETAAALCEIPRKKPISLLKKKGIYTPTILAMCLNGIMVLALLNIVPNKYPCYGKKMSYF